MAEPIVVAGLEFNNFDRNGTTNLKLCPKNYHVEGFLQDYQ